MVLRDTGFLHGHFFMALNVFNFPIIRAPRSIHGIWSTRVRTFKVEKTVETYSVKQSLIKYLVESSGARARRGDLARSHRERLVFIVLEKHKEIV